MKTLGVVLLLLTGSCQAASSQLPPNAVKYLPVLKSTIQQVWPDYKNPHYFFAQIEQESCISLKHSKCWNPRAELKTSREYGFGLGQTTIAYNANGTERFNNFNAAKQLLKREWKWEDRYNPAIQMEVMLRTSYKNRQLLKWPIANDTERDAFMFVAYNSGLGGIIKDQKLCNPPSCTTARWYGNVEKHSYKAKVAAKGYGKSFFEISREYPRNVFLRSAKYKLYF